MEEIQIRIGQIDAQVQSALDRNPDLRQSDEYQKYLVVATKFFSVDKKPLTEADIDELQRAAANIK
jgi:hypothetical protein